MKLFTVRYSTTWDPARVFNLYTKDHHTVQSITDIMNKVKYSFSMSAILGVTENLGILETPELSMEVARQIMDIRRRMKNLHKLGVKQVIKSNQWFDDVPQQIEYCGYNPDQDIIDNLEPNDIPNWETLPVSPALPPIDPDVRPAVTVGNPAAFTGSNPCAEIPLTSPSPTPATPLTQTTVPSRPYEDDINRLLRELSSRYGDPRGPRGGR